VGGASDSSAATTSDVLLLAAASRALPRQTNMRMRADASKYTCPMYMWSAAAKPTDSSE
jgi:hypothetical protein